LISFIVIQDENQIVYSISDKENTPVITEVFFMISKGDITFDNKDDLVVGSYF
jgi:hypothetical protein